MENSKSQLYFEVLCRLHSSVFRLWADVDVNVYGGRRVRGRTKRSKHNILFIVQNISMRFAINARKSISTSTRAIPPKPAIEFLTLWIVISLSVVFWLSIKKTWISKNKTQSKKWSKESKKKHFKFCRRAYCIVKQKFCVELVYRNYCIQSNQSKLSILIALSCSYYSD